MWAGLLLLACVASCGASKEAEMAGFTLTSEAFADGQPIPPQFTCDGADQAPPLTWGEPPKGTRSFALVVDDPDAPSGTFRHWGAFDIPASARSSSGPFQQALNDFGKVGYGGPCPPNGHGPHHYRFKLFALGTDRLNLSNPKVADVEAEAEKNVLGRARLTGTYERR
ncbi:MAG: YbhB/YbcL family Raf kinase inhibitor-like protein [Sphingomicrobium sp.]